MNKVMEEAHPVCMSSFFFEQLVPFSTEDTLVGGDIIPASVRISGVTKDEGINQVLWNSMAPSSYRMEVLRFLQDEHHRTQELKTKVDEMWQQVEQLIALNKRRRMFFNEERIQAQLRDVESICFWAAGDIPRRFGLDVSVGQEDKNRAAEFEGVKLTLDFSVLMKSRSNDVAEGGEAGKEEPGDADDLPPTATENETAPSSLPRSCSRRMRLVPTRRPHCLRRSFAPILQRRDELPKYLAYFLMDLKRIQSKELPGLEEKLQNSMLFNVPLHIPFQRIAQYITRSLTVPNPSESIESELVLRYDILKGASDRLEEFLEGASSNLDTIESLDEQARLEMSRQMWELLFTELETHKETHKMVKECYDEMTTACDKRIESLSTNLDKCLTFTGQAMSRLRNDAASCVEAIERSGSGIVTLIETAESEFEKDLVALEASIRAKSFTLSKSEAIQEKLARRVRQAVKELHTEQSKYARISQELLQDELSLAQLRVSHKQFQDALTTRYKGVSHANQQGKELQQMLAEAESVQSALLASCRQEIERQRSDDFYRRCRIVRYAVDNAQLWSRCVGDIAHLYEARHLALESKSEALSWPARYLIAAEKDWAVGNLLETRAEMEELHTKWLEVKNMADTMDMEIPNGTSTISKSSRRIDSTCGAQQSRKIMAVLDGPPRVNREVPTLRKYKASKGEHSKEAVKTAPPGVDARALADAAR